MNSVEATTKMEDLTVEKNKLLSQAAKTIAEYTTTGATGNVHEQIMNMCKGFAPEETVKILAMALAYVAKGSVGGGKSSKKSNSGSFKGSSSMGSSRNGVFGGSSFGSFTGR